MIYMFVKKGRRTVKFFVALNKPFYIFKGSIASDGLHS